MRKRTWAVGLLAAVAIGAAGGHALMPRDMSALDVLAKAPAPRVVVGPDPTCMYDWTGESQHFNVAGPAGQMITVNGHHKGWLVLVDEDVVDEVDLIAGGDGTNADIPFNGLRDNVELKRYHDTITVQVNGRTCKTT